MDKIKKGFLLAVGWYLGTKVATDIDKWYQKNK